jgi:spoIIIJ-associated protein
VSTDQPVQTDPDDVDPHDVDPHDVHPHGTAASVEDADQPDGPPQDAEVLTEETLDLPAADDAPAEANGSDEANEDAATAGDGSTAEADPAVTGVEDGEDAKDAEDSGDGQDEGAERPRSGSAAARLEREGEIAADFLERLLDIADLDGDLDVDVEGERASVAIVDSSEGRVPRRLVGQNGEVLEALQELTRLAVQARTGDRTRLMLDVAGHRARRREQLVVRAKEAIAEVKESGQPLQLEAMNPFERKIVHDTVAAAGLHSSSEGVEPDRRIVVRPAG